VTGGSAVVFAVSDRWGLATPCTGFILRSYFRFGTRGRRYCSGAGLPAVGFWPSWELRAFPLSSPDSDGSHESRLVSCLRISAQHPHHYESMFNAALAIQELLLSIEVMFDSFNQLIKV
jgi:hypothetical protein